MKQKGRVTRRPGRACNHHFVPSRTQATFCRPDNLFAKPPPFMVSPRKSPPPTKAAEPQLGRTFDPWNSSSTGHQRAENRLGVGTGWRESRNAKLQSQFRGGAGGGARVSDTVGAGSQDWDPRLQAVVPPELRARARTSVAEMLTRRGSIRRSLSTTGTASPSPVPLVPGSGKERADSEETRPAQRESQKKPVEPGPKPPRKIFEDVVVYVNGSTHPLISDHKLKQLLADHGASMSTHLGRKKVTHVILGRPTGGRSGAGGSLSSGKLQKEIRKLRGAAVQFVGVEW